MAKNSPEKEESRLTYPNQTVPLRRPRQCVRAPGRRAGPWGGASPADPTQSAWSATGGARRPRLPARRRRPGPASHAPRTESRPAPGRTLLPGAARSSPAPPTPPRGRPLLPELPRLHRVLPGHRGSRLTSSSFHHEMSVPGSSAKRQQFCAQCSSHICFFRFFPPFTLNI